MHSDNNHEFYETKYFIIVLAIVGGFLDAYTYIARGGVFANAQTGNVVLVGVYVAAGKWMEALKVIPAIVAFIAGVVLVEYVKAIKIKILNYDWVTIILFSKIILLFLIGLLPSSVPDIFVIVTVSFLASVQVSSFKNLIDKPCSTTMITANMRYCTEYAIGWFKENDPEQKERALRYFTIILAFLVGAVIGGVTIEFFELRSVWLCSFLLAILLVGYRVSYRKRA